MNIHDNQPMNLNEKASNRPTTNADRPLRISDLSRGCLRRGEDRISSSVRRGEEGEEDATM